MTYAARSLLKSKKLTLARRKQNPSATTPTPSSVFVTQDMLGKASPEENPDKAVRDTLVKTLIEPTAATVHQRFKDKPLIEAAVRNTLAQTLQALGRTDLAQPHAEWALDKRRKLLGADHLETLASLSNYAILLQSLGRAKEAEPMLAQVLAGAARC